MGWPRHQAKLLLSILHLPVPVCVCIYIVYQMSKHLSALTTKDCTEKHMDRYPLQSDTAGIDTHTYTLPKQCVKACLSHSALKLV